MSKIPFLFSPTPRFFRDKGFFTNYKNVAFVDWCFSKCSPDEHSEYVRSIKIILKPYQFIFGRLKCSEQTGLTEDEVRAQVKRWEKYGFLKKAPTKNPKLFTIYEWSLEAFLDSYPQGNPQETPKEPPSNPHVSDDKKIRNKKDHPPTPCLPNPTSSGDDVIDDSLSSKKEDHDKIEIYKNVLLTPAELQTCIAARGSREIVEQIAYETQSWVGRKSEIKDWVTTICNWNMKTQLPNRIANNEAFGKRLEENHGSGVGWKCRVYHDRNKDTRGVLFEGSGSQSDPIFILFSDNECKEKCNKVLRDKKMQKSRIPNP